MIDESFRELDVFAEECLGGVSVFFLFLSSVSEMSFREPSEPAEERVFECRLTQKKEARSLKGQQGCLMQEKRTVLVACTKDACVAQ